ncbi:MAG TPA: AarF/UbiB family protein [Myxococcota bacterium]|nr:AarF/UbiB family protein [Myxococcota bacterium]
MHGFVHADLPPGNLRFTPPGCIVPLDLGLVGTLDDADRLTTACLLFAFAMGDGATVARLFYDHAPSRATPDYPAYEQEIIEFVESVRKRGLGNLQVTLEIGGIFDVLRRHRIQARSHMTMVNLALMTRASAGGWHLLAHRRGSALSRRGTRGGAPAKRGLRGGGPSGPHRDAFGPVCTHIVDANPAPAQRTAAMSWPAARLVSADREV